VSSRENREEREEREKKKGCPLFFSFFPSQTFNATLNNTRREKRRKKRSFQKLLLLPFPGTFFSLSLSPMRRLSLFCVFSPGALLNQKPERHTKKKDSLSRAKKKRRWFLKSFLLGKDKKKEEEEKISIAPPTND
jgi:hypothetical protein